MSSLILNFDWDSSTKDSSNPKIKQTVGTWTQKLKQKKLAKHHQKLRNKDLTPQTTQQSTQSQTTSNTTAKQPPPQSESQSQSPQDTTGPRKKPKLDVKPPPAKFQIISSLFSSTIIPTIKPNPKDEHSSMVVYAPSNASLSEIKITSPSLNLHPQISQHLHSSTKVGPIHSPTSIQSIAWPLLSAQSNHSTTRDVIIQSETGSGKTLAYLVPIIQDLLSLPLNHPEINWNREIGTLAIILVPTRELAEQVYHVAINLLSFHQKNRTDSSGNTLNEVDGESDNKTSLNPRWLVPGTLHGGTNRTHEKARLRRGLPLLVCTPGRLLDHLEKTVSLRMAGEMKNIPHNGQERKTTTESNNNNNKMMNNLNLRWLVVDEADRLMDMGFEEQMNGILQHLKQRSTKKQVSNENQVNGRRTILCSATMPDGVKKLVGMSLNDPILLKATGLPPPPTTTSDEDQMPSNEEQCNNVQQVQKTENNSKFSAPSQLSQFYVITPPKLRLVSLIALLRQITNPKQVNQPAADKILVFMSCTASVDFHFEALGNIPTNDNDNDDNDDDEKENDDDDEEEENKKNEKLSNSKKSSSSTTQESNRSTIIRKSKLIPGVKIFRLHGSLDLQTRLKSLKKFSEKRVVSSSSSSSSILLCTSLAGRGLDVPYVSHVIQYDLPTEGGVNEYLHRIGRTARAGQSGQAWCFLLPSEVPWIDWCQTSQNYHLPSVNEQVGVGKSLKITQVDTKKLLANGFDCNDNNNDWESKATDTQLKIEKWVLENPKNHNLASQGFISHIRAYTTHPTQEKVFFNLKSLHLGHLAKSFGLRDTPKNLKSLPSSSSFKKEEKKSKFDSWNKKQQQQQQTSLRKRKSLHDDEDLDDIDIDDDDDDDDYLRKNGSSGGAKNFFPLSQSNPFKNSNSLKGPLGNSIDEFNLG